MVCARNRLASFALIVILTHPSLINCETDWTYDILAVETDNKTPDIVEVEYEVTRITRGVFGLSGVINIKQNLTDDCLISTSTYYSLAGLYYVKTPFAMPVVTLSTFLNSFYKDLIMDSCRECMTNIPIIEEEFVAPLTARVMSAEACLVANDNFPSRIKTGFYKVLIEFTGQVQGHIEVLIKVDSTL